MQQTEKNRIEYLTSAFLEKGLNAKEQDELKALLQEPDMRAYFKQSYLIWNTRHHKVTDSEIAYNKLLSAINKESAIPNKPSERKLRLGWMPGVAASLLAFVLGMGSYYLIDTKLQSQPAPNQVALVPQEPSISISRISVPLGSKSQVDLPDGTVVTLNAGSSLEYSTDYGKELREVKLDGEGYFQVAKNENSAFIVTAKDAEIKALGTAFNVKAYFEEDYVQTTLVEGSVSIRPDKTSRDTREIILKPNEMATIRGLNNISTVKSAGRSVQPTSPSDIRRVQTKVSTQIVNPVLYTSWKDKRWVIESEEMESLILKLERRYDVKITIASKGLEKYKFSGTFQDETLEQVLDIMKSMAPINYTLDKKTVILTINPKQNKIFEKSMTN